MKPASTAHLFPFSTAMRSTIKAASMSTADKRIIRQENMSRRIYLAAGSRAPKVGYGRRLFSNEKMALIPFLFHCHPPGSKIAEDDTPQKSEP
jgi:hypothetical protein